MPTVKKPVRHPNFKGWTPGYWVVIAGDSGKVVLQAKTVHAAVKLAKKKGIKQPSYDIIPSLDGDLILSTTPTIPLLGASC